MAQVYCSKFGGEPGVLPGLGPELQSHSGPLAMGSQLVAGSAAGPVGLNLLVLWLCRLWDQFWLPVWLLGAVTVARVWACHSWSWV